ncbi:hypothetical protein ACHAPD_009311 [Fusarium lateritium]
MLAPGLNETDSSVQHFFCNIAAYKDFTGMTAICGQMTTGDIIRRGKWNYRIAGSAILDTDEMRDCVICSDPFDTSGDDFVPEHFAVIQLPCCAKFIHTQCFKGVTTGKKQACSFCNADLETIGMNLGDGTEFLSFSLRPAELPPGLHRFSTDIENAIARFVDPRGIALLKELNKVIEDEEDIPRGALGAVYKDWPMNAN